MVYRHVHKFFSILNLVGAGLTTALGVSAFLFGPVAVLFGSLNGCVRGSVSTFGTGRSIRRDLDASRIDSSRSLRFALPHRSPGQNRDVLRGRPTFAEEASRFTMRSCSSGRVSGRGYVSTLTNSRGLVENYIRLSRYSSQFCGDRRSTYQFRRCPRFFPAALPSQFSRLEQPAIAL